MNRPKYLWRKLYKRLRPIARVYEVRRKVRCSVYKYDPGRTRAENIFLAGYSVEALAFMHRIGVDITTMHPLSQETVKRIKRVNRFKKWMEDRGFGWY